MIYRKDNIVYVLGLLIAIVLQSLHYILYYKQETSTSFLWSTVDWNIWFLMTLFLISFSAKRSINSLLLVITLLVLFPLLHVVISKLVYLTIFEPSRSFTDDIIRQLSKRWFQNILIAISLYFIFTYIRSHFFNAKESKKRNLEENKSSQIKLKDGNTTYRLDYNDIKWINSARNYVIIETTTNKQIVVRRTISSLYDVLEGNGFIRISRSTIINTSLLYSIKRKTKYKHSVFTKSGREFSVGKTYLKEVMSIVEL